MFCFQTKYGCFLLIILITTRFFVDKGRFCNNSEIDILTSKRLSVENKAKLSEPTRADFVAIAKLTH